MRESGKFMVFGQISVREKSLQIFEIGNFHNSLFIVNDQVVYLKGIPASTVGTRFQSVFHIFKLIGLFQMKTCYCENCIATVESIVRNIQFIDDE